MYKLIYHETGRRRVTSGRIHIFSKSIFIGGKLELICGIL